VSRPPLLGAFVSGSSAWIIYQLLHESLPRRVRQLECDPNVSGEVVRHLRGTAAAIEEAARQYRQLVSEVSDSTEVRSGGSGSQSDSPLRWGTAGLVAETLGCSPRWVTQLIAMGRVSATKRGRSWLVDLDSVEDFKRRGLNAA
jgi:excisionase family DNA binding protein